MKRSTMSLTFIVDVPFRSCLSNISKTDASSFPEIRISASSSEVFTILGSYRFDEAFRCGGDLRADDVVEGQRRARLCQHTDPHPELGLCIDGSAHHGTDPAGFFVQIVVDFHNAHEIAFENAVYVLYMNRMVHGNAVGTAVGGSTWG